MKRLLFIGPTFYNYHLTIKKGFEDAGYIVDYYNDRPSTSFLTKVLLRLNKNLIRRKIAKYFESIKENTKNTKYDVVFVLYGQSFTKEMMLELKQLHNESRFVFYMYDPLCSMSDRVEMKDVFDDCFSFDYKDCLDHPEFKLVPLFYSYVPQETKSIDYDVSAIVTMMPGKYLQIKEMVRQLEQHGLSVYKHYYLQSRLAYLFYKLKYKEFKHSKMKEFRYKRISKEENDKVIMSSKYVLDCPKEGQTGLTIRSLEALAANKKFITTNETIKKYDFYEPTNVYVFKDRFDFEDSFFTDEYLAVEDCVKLNYSIDSWVKKILINC